MLNWGAKIRPFLKTIPIPFKNKWKLGFDVLVEMLRRHSH